QGKARRFWDFLNEGLWEPPPADRSKTRSVLVRAGQIFVLTIRGFDLHHNMDRARVLTFFSILSMVPALALILGIGKGFGLDQVVERQLYEWFSGQELVVGQILEFSLTLLAQTSGGLIAGAGLLFLLWSVYRVFLNLEKAFNAIWDFRKKRSPGRMLVDYLFAAFFGFILWVFSSAAAVVAATHLKEMMEGLEFLGAARPFILAALGIAPYCGIWMLLSFFYIFLPNGKINWSSGIMAGIITGTVYMLFQYFYIGLQVGVTQNNAIYGSFAAVPLLLLWLQFSWAIILFGAELAFSHQNAKNHINEPHIRQASLFLQKSLALALVWRAVLRFKDEKEPESAREMAQALNLPLKNVFALTKSLVDAGLFSQIIARGNQATSFAPAFDIERMSIAFVVKKYEAAGLNSLPGSPALAVISKALADLLAQVSKAPKNVLLKDIPLPE
ncbi:MAG: YihY/virulence factor BrkB family protein, partial [Desulfatibacillaceae bacterium]|nr:YihY/virulence factor BrkB family protein [Desulfatibacillaceae bacterium]